MIHQIFSILMSCESSEFIRKNQEIIWQL